MAIIILLTKLAKKYKITGSIAIACDNDSVIDKISNMIRDPNNNEILTKTNDYDIIATTRDMLR